MGAGLATKQDVIQLVIGGVFILFAALTGDMYGPVHVRPFFEADPSISYPKVATETVPFLELCIYAGLIPLCIAIIVPAMVRKHVGFEKPVKPVTNVFLSVSTLLTAAGITAFLTTFIKRYAGRLRPNFFALCKYEPYDPVTNMYGTPNQFGSFANCTGTEYEVLSSHLSFPSGHSSWSFCGLGFVSLLMYFTLRSGPDKLVTKYLTFILCGAPILFAALIAASRTRDNYHHFADVLCGSALGGAVVSCVFWSMYPKPQFRVAKKEDEDDDPLLQSAA